MKTTNESPHEWIKIIGLGAIVVLVTTAILLFARIGMQPGTSEVEPALASETPQPYPPPPTEAEEALSAYPPPQPTPEFVATETPEPTLEWVLIGTDEWGIPTTPPPTLGPPVVVTHEPGLIDAVIPLVSPAADARGTLIYFVSSKDGESIAAQGIEMDVESQSLVIPKSISNNIFLQSPWIYPSPNGSRIAIMGSWGVSDVLNTYSGEVIRISSTLPVEIFFNWHPDNVNILVGYGGELFLENIDDKNYVKLVSNAIKGAGGRVGEGAVSADGQKYVYADRGQSGDIMWLVSLNGLETSQVYTGQTDTYSWSPDGQLIAFYADGVGYMVMDADGSHPHQVAELYRPLCYSSSPLWSPNSKILAVVVDTGRGTAFCKGWTEDVFKDTNIYLIEVDSGTSHPLLSDGILGNIDPAWSPDGRYLAFVSNRSGAPEVWVAAIDGSSLQQLTNAGQYVRFPFWRRP